ncbi:MAG: glycerol dehydrogenase [Alkalinema sp. CACIAM 70d]|nr:MAG: glycerol dehydrogenase [Alkalinema sp. CACIAM 70d]
MELNKAIAVTSATSTPQPTETVELAPSYKIPIVLLLAGFAGLFVQVWVGLPIFVFGLFLLIQTASLRLTFTATDLDVYRGETRIRRFPYREWQNWEIFWSPIPILFYFKEVNSIHFLPILFNPQQLRTCLEQRCPRINP